MLIVKAIYHLSFFLEVAYLSGRSICGQRLFELLDQLCLFTQTARLREEDAEIGAGAGDFGDSE